MNKHVEQLEGNPGIYPQPHEEEGGLSGSKEPLIDPRKERIEWWRNARYKILNYPGGSRLLMGDETKEEVIEVMDSCQTPWAHATVDRAFEELGIRDRPIDVDVLERGFGMGIIASRIIQNLSLHGGSYTVIELNKQNADWAKRRWKPNQLSALTRSRTALGSRSNHNVDINIIEGEAYEETAKLAEKGRKFDIIISDTYPLTEDERGMNDLLDLETLKRCLKPDGVFGFFAHFPGSTEALAYKQVSMITRHFRNYRVSQANINPPQDYKYLQPDTGPIISLPVVVCKNPIL